MTKLVKTLAALALAGTTFAAGPALARVTANGVQINGLQINSVQKSGIAGKATEADGQALRAAGPVLARITGNGVQVNGVQVDSAQVNSAQVNSAQVNRVQNTGIAGKATEADGQALRVIGIEFAR